MILPTHAIIIALSLSLSLIHLLISSHVSLVDTHGELAWKGGCSKNKFDAANTTKSVQVWFKGAKINVCLQIK